MQPDPASAPAPEPVSWSPRATRHTPTLNELGSDLTRLAAEGRLLPMIGRAKELDRIILTLCRRIKPNPLLVGAAGTGKTAIIEGLAQQIVAGDVPPDLIGTRIIALQPSSLVAGADTLGAFEERAETVIAEASQDGIILFIDELHTAFGTGGTSGTTDFAQLLKPALARGDFSCIGATTDDEYRRHIEPDEALARRFDTIKVHEMTEGETLLTLYRIRDDPRFNRGIVIEDGALVALVDFTARYMRNRRFPDKAIDLLDHVVASARSHRDPIITTEFANRIASDLLGVPDVDAEGLEQLARTLVERGLMDAEDAAVLTERLSVTTLGLDITESRPNAVILLEGHGADRVDELAAVLAETLYGSATRVVSLEFASMSDAHMVSTLIGAPPSYRGYQDRHALDAIAESPMTVVIARSIDAAHWQVRTTFEQAIDRGVITDLRGKRIYFSDTVMLLTVADASETEGPRSSVGFLSGDDDHDDRSTAPDSSLYKDIFGERTVDYLDLVIRSAPIASSSGVNAIDSVSRSVLSGFEERLLSRGITVTWHDSLLAWLLPPGGNTSADRLTRTVEREVIPQVVAKAFASDRTSATRQILVKRTDDGIEVERVG
jgi:ATP-dependent Clp protease ATP-binding subunit ClpC